MTPPKTLAEAFEEICASEALLSERLAAYAGKARELNQPMAEAYDTFIARAVAGDVGVTAPRVGDTMPGFVLPGRDGRLVSLGDVTSRGPAVVSFNRGHWCSYCKIELRTLADHHDEISEAGAVMVSIMPERQRFAALLRKLTLDKFEILTDTDNGYALSLGLVVPIGGHLKELIKIGGHDLGIYQGSDGWFVPVPATFVVSPQGIIWARFVDPDFRRRMEIGEILAVLRSHHPGSQNNAEGLNGSSEGS